jgi:hypothetical protein
MLAGKKFCYSLSAFQALNSRCTSLGRLIPRRSVTSTASFNAINELQGPPASLRYAHNRTPFLLAKENNAHPTRH